jgi:hypothetical protein
MSGGRPAAIITDTLGDKHRHEGAFAAPFVFRNFTDLALSIRASLVPVFVPLFIATNPVVLRPQALARQERFRYFRERFSPRSVQAIGSQL